jgi:hypothetical protein
VLAAEAALIFDVPESPAPKLAVLLLSMVFLIAASPLHTPPSACTGSWQDDRRGCRRSLFRPEAGHGRARAVTAPGGGGDGMAGAITDIMAIAGAVPARLLVIHDVPQTTVPDGAGRGREDVPVSRESTAPVLRRTLCPPVRLMMTARQSHYAVSDASRVSDEMLLAAAEAISTPGRRARAGRAAGHACGQPACLRAHRSPAPRPPSAKTSRSQPGRIRADATARGGTGRPHRQCTFDNSDKGQISRDRY